MSAGYGSYGGGYNRLGGLGSSYSSGYGGYGGYGSSFGSSFGSSYGGYNSYSPYNRFGSYGSPYNQFGYGYGAGGPTDVTFGQQMEAGTRATFELIEQIVGAFGGFAQMLDATFIATHSSFMAMVGVAEQFGHVHTYLGNIFNIYNLIRWIKRSYCKLTGKPAPIEPTPQEQQQLQQQLQQQDLQGNQLTPDDIPPPPPSRQRLDKTPFIIFISAVIALPYLMNKLMKSMSARRISSAMENHNQPPIAVANFDFVPSTPMELRLTKGATVEVLDTLDPVTREPSSWWQGRLRDGSIGMFPANHVQYVSQQPTGTSGFNVDDFDKKF
jgi:peroxin-13